MISKSQFIIEIINFGTKEHPITARSVYNKFKISGEKVEDYQRICAKYAREILREQFELNDLVERKRMILSVNGGYYTATSRNEALEGLQYYEKKIRTMLAFRSKMKKTIDDTFPQKIQTDMFVEEG